MRQTLTFALIIAVMAGCSGGGSPVSVDLVSQDRAADATPDVEGPDIAVDTGLDIAVEPDEWELDLRPDEGTGPACAPGEGCFLDPCSENGQCQSGWCVEHLGEGVCTQLCEEECPPGWSCRQVGTGPDIAYVCVSKVANLCRPCATGADCKSPGGSEDVCVDYGVEGSFCGGKCATDGDCPWGFSCAEAVTVDGIAAKQCVADAGVCPCTSKAVDLGLSTPCAVANEFGTCAGKRFCTDQGLTDCDAAAPSIEECNGEDDNCDGDVDEALFVGGKYVDLCDDQNDCTDDVCMGTEGCEHVALSGVECKDGNPCTVADTCEEGVCVGTTVDCDDGNPCTDDSCNSAGGCNFVDNDAACDDGSACTVADRCDAGVCSGVAVNCDCQEDADCAPLEDGNACNGTLFCNLDGLPYQCEVAPESVVTCPEPPEGPDQFCLAASCNPANGSCSIVPAHEGYACDDGNPCTVGEHCVAGACADGVAPNCNDGNPCTDDTCNPAEGCLSVDNDVACNDGNACTTADTCAGGECVGGPALDCDDGNPCTGDSCDAATGCKHTFVAGACDDGNACTPTDTCVNGFCKGGGLMDCDDQNPCTKDSCDPEQGCVHQLTSGPCDDQDLCTTGDHCHLGECIGGGSLPCSDGNPCTDDSCDPDIGCLFVDNDDACDDGNACTITDQCVNGSCKGSGAPDCDDGAPCTKDSCDPAVGCVHVSGDGPCDDGDLCTVLDHCEEGACVGGGQLPCDDGNACTDDSCNAEDGCVFLPNTAACDDGNACTEADQCKDGWCLSGAPKACDDANVCTDDSCNPQSGCVHSPNAAICNDGDPCTVTDLCSEGACTGSGTLACDDGNKCTADNCVPGEGCVYLPTTPCCGNGQVEGGEECDDGNEVDADACRNDCTLPSVSRTVPGFGGTLGPDLSGQGWSQCAGTGSLGVMGKQFYPLCEGYAEIRFACSVDNNESAEYLSGAFSLAGKTLLDNQCDDWVGASNSIYGSDYILSVDSSDPNCGNYNVGYDMYVHFGGQWGCAGTYNTHGTGGRMFAYVKE